MKTKHLIALSALLTAAPVMAQEARTTSSNEEKSEYQFKPHSYLQIQGGVQHTLGEMDFGDLISPNVQVGFGYQFKSWIGARLSVNAWQSRGGFSGYKETPAPAYTAKYKFNYVAPSIDVMFDLTNAIGGFNPKRVVSVSAFAGAGVNIGFSNDEANELHALGYKMGHIWDGTQVLPVGRMGLGVDFRLSDVVSLGLEANANITSDKYNSKDADNPDWYFNGLATLKFNLGKTYTTKTVVPAEPVVETPQVEEEVVEEKPVIEQPVVEEKAEPMRRDVFFKINSSTLSTEQAAKVAELGQFMRQNKDVKVTITGYADAKTGSAAYNEKISAKRAEAVKTQLMKRHGISADRITVKYEGSKVQPFSVNEENRVSICVTE